ncbi:MAG: hypothetical protein JRJ41_02780 [Deltaproteobacteria bacterium]|nr:hypothetical protein [Deltaproteobacteria bacterium]
MGYDSYINGFIDGISEDSFELIKEDLEDVFDDVFWNGNVLEIDSYGKHYNETVFPVYNKIAFCIDDGGGGRLDGGGEGCSDLSSIFFIPRKWKQVWAKIIYPENPFINKSTNITYSKTAYVHLDPLLLDSIKNELEGWANGDENICISWYQLIELLASGDIENKETYHFLKTVQNEVIEDVGDIVFHS